MSANGSKPADHVHLDPKTAVGDFATALDPAIGRAAGLNAQLQGILGSVQLGGDSVGAIPGVRHLVAAFGAHLTMTGGDLDTMHKAMTDLQTAARTIQANYDAAQDLDKISGDEIKAAMNPAAAGTLNPAGGALTTGTQF